MRQSCPHYRWVAEQCPRPTEKPPDRGFSSNHIVSGRNLTTIEVYTHLSNHPVTERDLIQEVRFSDRNPASLEDSRPSPSSVAAGRSKLVSAWNNKATKTLTPSRIAPIQRTHLQLEFALATRPPKMPPREFPHAIMSLQIHQMKTLRPLRQVCTYVKNPMAPPLWSRKYRSAIWHGEFGGDQSITMVKTHHCRGQDFG